MNSRNHEIRLQGCSPTPLAHYLKALGILRLVAEQADPNAMGWWKDDTFYLRSKLEQSGLTEFFLVDYKPTPFVAPWNGGSGFYPNDNQEALTAIASGTSLRFQPYRGVISLCRSIVAGLSDDQEKPKLLQLCRNLLPDLAVDWLDAAFVLTAAGPKYPPLLGTGGNDGRLEFTNNFMQHLIALLSPDDGVATPESKRRLHECIFGELSDCRHRGAIGQYDPGSLGGFNNGSGFEGRGTVNGWDYLLMLEGAIMFAAACAKQLETCDTGTLSYPFCVRPAGVGYGSADASDEASARAEMWLPLWNQPATFRSISILLSEGRVETRKRKARNGVDFARAIASLGIDRGISEFQRFGFQQRNGLAYFAVPLGRFRVKENPRAEELLSPLDSWLDRFRRSATGKTAPARAGRALRQLESSILRLCQRGVTEDVQAVLIALGEAEATVAISKQLRDGDMGNGLSPLPLLSPEWLINAYDGSREFRLAAALASVSHDSVGPFRRHLEPIDELSWKSSFPKWSKEANDPAIVWGSGDLIQNLCAVLSRRLIDVFKVGKDQTDSSLLAPLRGRCCASLSDVAAFIDGHVDDSRIDQLIKALMLIGYPAIKEQNSVLYKHAIDLAIAIQLNEADASMLSLLSNYLPYDADDSTIFAKAMRHIRFAQATETQPDAAYALLKLCHLPHKLLETAVVLVPQISRRAIAGDGVEATRLASRRLVASGFQSAVESVPINAQRTVRIAAALLIPISKRDSKALAERVLRSREALVEI